MRKIVIKVIFQSKDDTLSFVKTKPMDVDEDEFTQLKELLQAVCSGDSAYLSLDETTEGDYVIIPSRLITMVRVADAE